jgi:hypothetical protein
MYDLPRIKPEHTEGVEKLTLKRGGKYHWGGSVQKRGEVLRR